MLHRQEDRNKNNEKNQNIKTKDNIVTHLRKTLKMIHIKKSLKGKKNQGQRTSLVVQWLRLCGFTAEGMSLIPDQGKTTGRVVWPKGKKKNNDKLLKQDLQN